MSENKIIAVIPAYKPDETLVKVALELNERGYELVVVNDGSGADYDSVFIKTASFAKIITLGENQGKGCALKAGLTYVRNNFTAPYTVVTVDADGQHKLKDTCNIVDIAVKNPDKLVIGKRNLKLEGTPFRSKVGNNITHFGFRQATLTHLNETQTGLRAFSDRIIDKIIDVKGTRYEYEMIMLMKLTRLGVPIIEEDIETVYEDGNSSSHFNPLPDSVRIYFSIIKFAFPSFLCFFIDLSVFITAYILGGGFLLQNTGGLSFLWFIICCAFTARIISTPIDLLINKRNLFKRVKNIPRTVLLYILLFAAVLMTDSFIVYGLSAIGIIPFAGKIISALIITWFSRIIQTKIFEK